MMFGSQFNRREKKDAKKNLPEEVILFEKRLAFDGQRHPLPAAYTECRNAFAGIALFHFMHQLGSVIAEFPTTFEAAEASRTY